MLPARCVLPEPSFAEVAVTDTTPSLRNLEGDFVGGDFGQGLFGAEFLGGDEAGFFGLDAVEELARGFHVRVGGAPVGGQLALNRLLQDGLLELGEEGLLGAVISLLRSWRMFDAAACSMLLDESRVALVSGGRLTSVVQRRSLPPPVCGWCCRDWP